MIPYIEQEQIFVLSTELTEVKKSNNQSLELIRNFKQAKDLKGFFYNKGKGKGKSGNTSSSGDDKWVQKSVVPKYGQPWTN